jgi:hypothetical protein
VTSGGAAVAGAPVTVQVTDPKGKLSTLAATTGSNGAASVSYALSLKSSVAGTYAVNSSSSVGGVSGSATTSFTAQ